jgi:hypothetical protein
MRPRLAAAALAALAALATTACTTAPGSPATTPTPTKAAITVLEEAAAKSKGQSFKYTLTYGDLLTGDGYQDASGQNLSRNVTIKDSASGLTIKASGLVFPDALYLKIDLGALTAQIPGLSGLGDKWLVADRTKIGTEGMAAFLTAADSSTPEAYVKGVVTAEQVSPTEIKGTVDLSKTTTGLASAEELAALGDAGKSVPFTITLDAQGRIGKIVMNMPKMDENPAADLTTVFTDYGTAVEVPKPAADQTVPAPEMIYLFLQS